MENRTIEEIAETIRTKKVSFKPEHITVLSDISSNSIRLGLFLNKDKANNKMYYITKDKLTDNIVFEEGSGVRYIDGDFVEEGTLKDVLELISSNKNEMGKIENKEALQILSELPNLESLTNKKDFTKNELIQIEKLHNYNVKEVAKRKAFEINFEL